MKKLLMLIAGSGLMMWSCTEEAPPEEPPANEDLIVGTWQSQYATHRITVNGVSNGMDSAYSSLLIQFTDGMNFMFRESNSINDTSRYNVKGDSLFLIRNALAYDTLYIDFLDNNNLKLVTESKESSIAGKLLLEETVIGFFKLTSE